MLQSRIVPLLLRKRGKSFKMQRNNEQSFLFRAILYADLGSLRQAQQGFQRTVSMKKSTENRKKEALAGSAGIAARTRISSQSQEEQICRQDFYNNRPEKIISIA